MATEIPKPQGQSQEQQKPSFFARLAARLHPGYQISSSQKPEDPQLPILPILKDPDVNLGWRVIHVKDRNIPGKPPVHVFTVISPIGQAFERFDAPSPDEALRYIRDDYYPPWKKATIAIDREKKTRKQEETIEQGNITNLETIRRKQKIHQDSEEGSKDPSQASP